MGTRQDVLLAEPQASVDDRSYVRGDGSNSGRLQFSLAEHRHGKVPDATEQTLIGICEKLTNGVSGRKEMLSRSGKCEFGTFGTVVAMGDFLQENSAFRH
jgi:hypothetical protein